MKEINKYLSAVPDWTRWVLLLPATMIIALLVNLLVLTFIRYGLMFFIGEELASITTQTMGSFVLAFLFVYIGGLIAPSDRSKVSVLLGFAFVIFSLYLFVYVLMNVNLGVIWLGWLTFNQLLTFLGVFIAYKQVEGFSTL